MTPKPITSKANQVTGLLHDWRNGRPGALDQLMPLVYDQLRNIAARQLAHESPDHTLRATELVHEAYLKLLGSNVSINDRAHFYALASRVIRHVLINHGAQSVAISAMAASGSPSMRQHFWQPGSPTMFQPFTRR